MRAPEKRRILEWLTRQAPLLRRLKFEFGWEPKARLDLSIGPVRAKLNTKEKRMIEIKITNEEKITVTLKPVTRTDRPAKLDGKPTWTVVNGEATVKPSTDGLSAELISSDTPGANEILVEADADLGEGVETISEHISLIVSGAQASNLGIEVGLPEAKDVPPVPSAKATKAASTKTH